MIILIQAFSCQRKGLQLNHVAVHLIPFPEAHDDNCYPKFQKRQTVLGR